MPRSDAPRLCRVAGRTTWHIYHQRRRISTGCEDRAAAEAVLARFLEGEDEPQGTTYSIKKLLELYLQNRRERDIAGLERLEWAHKPLVRHFGEKPIDIINEDACRIYLRWRAEERVSGGTVRTELQALRAALNWGVESKKIAEAPKVWLPSRPAPRDRWLTRDEAERLLAACRAPHVKLFVMIALRTGARKSAILGLEWSRVNLEHRLIDFVTGHRVTRKRRARVPINDTLYAALVEAHGARETEYVIEYAGDRIASIKHAFKDACDRAGLLDVMPHTLRHTAATWMAQAGVSLWEIAGFLGHTDMAMIADTYGHWHPDHMQEAAKALG
jgi:integrase